MKWLLQDFKIKSDFKFLYLLFIKKCNGRTSKIKINYVIKSPLVERTQIFIILLSTIVTDYKEKKEREARKKREEKMEDEITADTYNSCARRYAYTRRNLRCNFLLNSKVY